MVELSVEFRGWGITRACCDGMCRIEFGSNADAEAVAIEMPAISEGESLGAGGLTSGAQHPNESEHSSRTCRCCKLSLNVIKCHCTISTDNVKSHFQKLVSLTVRHPDDARQILL